MNLARPLNYLLAVGSVALTVVCVHALMRSVDRGPVYSVTTVQAGLAHHPDAWVGRTVWVRGVAWRCPDREYGECLLWSPVLSDPSVDTVLALVPQPATPLLALVRAMPLVGRLLPPGQALRWGVLASYRVQIRAVPVMSCIYWPCYAAVLRDATPDTL